MPWAIFYPFKGVFRLPHFAQNSTHHREVIPLTISAN